MKKDDYTKDSTGGKNKGILGQNKGAGKGGGMGTHHAVKNDSLGSPFEGARTKGTTRMEGKR